MATINEAGAAIKTLLEYKAEVDAGYLDIDPGWNIEPESPDGQAIAIWCEMLANLDEQVINAYRSVDPNTAIGQQLDRIASIAGISRQSATFSTATVTFTGIGSTVIPAGTQVRNADTDTLWSTDEEAVISGSSVDAQVTCEVSGPEPAGVGDLSIIATPIGGISSVTNANAASLGREREPDAVFRARRNASVARLGRNQLESMIGDLADIADVNHAKAYENFTGSTDANGLAPHSIVVFIDGGDSVAIAEAIAVNKCPGTGMNAAAGFPNMVQETVTTENGATLTITFFRPVMVSAFVHVTVAGDLVGGVGGEIKQAIVDYANATLFGASIEGFDRVGFSIGDNVQAGKLYTPVNRIIGATGHTVSITLGTSAGSVNDAVLDIDFNELPVFDVDNIEVTIQ